jgi:hypothetical protein
MDAGDGPSERRVKRLKIITLAGLAALDLAAALFAWRGFADADGGEILDARLAPKLIPAALSDAPAMAGGDDPETLARPLFAKSRRPFQGGSRVANVASAAAPPAGLKLHAVIGFNHSVRAFVTSSAAADGKWISIGEMVENWTVDSISAQEIALRQNANLLRVGLDYDRAPAPVVPIPAPPPPAVSENLDDDSAAKVVAPAAASAVKDAKRGGH